MASVQPEGRDWLGRRHLARNLHGTGGLLGIGLREHAALRTGLGGDIVPGQGAASQCVEAFSSREGRGKRPLFGGKFLIFARRSNQRHVRGGGCRTPLSRGCVGIPCVRDGRIPLNTAAPVGRQQGTTAYGRERSGDRSTAPRRVKGQPQERQQSATDCPRSGVPCMREVSRRGKAKEYFYCICG
jgi:hypothetical protein